MSLINPVLFSSPERLSAIAFGGWEALVIVVVVLVLFGPSKLPQLGDSLGKGIQNFRRAFQSAEEEPQSAEVVEAKAITEEPRVEAPASEQTQKEESRS